MRYIQISAGLLIPTPTCVTWRRTPRWSCQLNGGLITGLNFIPVSVVISRQLQQFSYKRNKASKS